MRRYSVGNVSAGVVGVAETPPVRPRAGELTRAHAVNVAAATGCLIASASVAAWTVARVAGAEVELSLLGYALPVAAVGSLSSGAVALLRFTMEHRRAVYGFELELEPDEPTREPRSGAPMPGTLLRGPDGALHRFDLVLTRPEVEAIKRVLLSEGRATVRSLLAVVGERASLLRGELIRLGVCERPQSERAAAMLTERGRGAIERW